MGRRGGRGGWVPASAGTTIGGPSPLGSRFRRERRLGSPPLRGMGDRLRPAAPLDTAPYRGTGQAFRRYDGWGIAPTWVTGRDRRPRRPSGFPLPRERRLGSRPYAGSVEDGEGPRPSGRPSGYRLRRYDGWGIAPTWVRRGRGGTTRPPLGSRFRGNDGWGSPLRRGPTRTGRDHARSTLWAKVAARAQGPACGESCRVSGQTSAALWLPAGTAPLLRILPGWGSLYRQCTTRHH